MKTYFTKSNRTVTYEFALTGTPIGDSASGEPTLKLRVSHYASRKALTATVSYIEKDQGNGYAIEKWQSDWPLVQIASVPANRYSEKALRQLAENTLTDFLNGAYDHPKVNALLNRIITEEAAA